MWFTKCNVTPPSVETQPQVLQSNQCYPSITSNRKPHDLCVCVLCAQMQNTYLYTMGTNRFQLVSA